MIVTGNASDPAAGDYVTDLLTRPTVATQRSIQIEHTYRVRCPQCHELPDSPYTTLVDARNAQRTHWTDHRDERI